MKLELGAEPKKLAILLGLILVGAYVFYDNVLNTGTAGGGSPAPARKSALAEALTPAAPVTPAAAPRVTPPRVPGGRSRTAEFRPSLKAAAQEAGDPAKIDPTLRLDLLQKVAGVVVERVDRSLFDFATAPPPKAEAAKPKLPEPKIVVAKKRIGPPEAPPPPE